VPSELRVGDLVAEVPELGRRVDALEKVSEPAPAGRVEENRLVDDVGTGAHCSERVGGTALEIPGAVAELDGRDALPRRKQRSEVLSLVLVTLASDELALRIVECWSRELAASNNEVERGQMLTLEEMVEV
jgi:hypothetical protein